MTISAKDKIEKIIELNKPISRVWKALTDHREFGKWFRVKLNQPFQLGAASTGQMSYPGYENVPWLAYIEQMEHELLFAFRWYDSEKTSLEEIENEPSILVEFQLEKTSKGTWLKITESGFSALPEPRRTELMRSNKEGWDIQAKNLTEYLHKDE